jgi:aryl-alcohol dehydrogenase-like predicted oxidoreductase
MKSIETVPFGKDGPPVTRVGLGGEGVLRTWGAASDARVVITRALEEGITYCESARVYDGSESYYGSLWSEKPEARAGIFQTSKSASRDRDGALRDLETTLSTLDVQHLDLWQIHDVRTFDDLAVIEGPGGSLEAFLEAKEEGTAHRIGVTGHQDPEVLLEAVRRWPVDSVLLPVNPVEGVMGGFTDQVIPEAIDQGIAVVAMKVLGGGHYLSSEGSEGGGEGGIDAGLLIRYALSHGVTLAIVGCSTPGEVEELARAGRDFKTMSAEEMEELEGVYRPHIDKLAYYRGTI